MNTRLAASSVAILFALSAPADALFGGGGGRSTDSDSRSSSSKSRSGGASVGASVGRGGASVGASVGGVSAGASVGRSGVSAGASAGGASVGTSVGRSGVSAGASVGGASVGTSVGRSGISAGVSAGGVSAGADLGTSGLDTSVSVGDTSISATAGTSGIGASVTSGEEADDVAAVSNGLPATAAQGFAGVVLLPPELLPGSDGNRSSNCHPTFGGCADRLQTGRASAEDAPRGRLDVEPGTPVPVVTACQRAAAGAAEKYGAVMVEGASAGRLRAMRGGGAVAPVTLRITYPNVVREAEVSCTLAGNGQVTALT